MAQPYEKNGRWYFRYRDAKGAWRDKASSARTKTEARRLQLELERRRSSGSAWVSSRSRLTRRS
jgi:hypothetical protein